LRFLGVVSPKRGVCPSDYDQRRIAAALARIGDLGSLDYLELQGIETDDAELDRLRQLTRLKSLDLSGTKTTDPGYLAKLTRLEELDLSDSPIGDAGLAHLRQL
jgi:Leucine-rich repeat (LRR) protein